MRYGAVQWAVAVVAALLIRLLSWTWRVRLTGPDPYETQGPRVFCFWHGHQAGLFAHPRPHPLVALSSLSRDGALQARILTLLGIRAIRGSSSRGGAAGLKGIVRAINGGADALFAVDGPRGPCGKVKPGAVLAARRCSAALIPLAAIPSRAWVFTRAWDRYALPKPFARVEIIRGHPLPAAPGTVEGVTDALERALLEVPVKENDN